MKTILIHRRISFLLLILLLLQIISCQKEINYSDVQIEDIERDDFDPYSMEISSNEDVDIYLEATGDYPDGTYCAEVEYYNPNTGTRSTYDLDVDVESGDLIMLHWPNGGWLDETHFTPENISSGEVEFTSDRDYRYTVTLGDYGGCSYTDDYKIRRDVNEDVEEEARKKEAETCPQCGGDKYQYEEICYFCKSNNEREEQDKIDHTCTRCGGHKFSSFDEYCDNCERELENNDEY